MNYLRKKISLVFLKLCIFTYPNDSIFKYEAGQIKKLWFK